MHIVYAHGTYAVALQGKVIFEGTKKECRAFIAHNGHDLSLDSY